MKHTTAKIIGVLGLNCVILLGIALSSELMFPDSSLFVGQWMHFDYLRTAGSFPHIDPTPPFCWRLLAPFLAHILSSSTVTGFFLITYLSILLSGLLVFLIAEHLFVQNQYAWVAVLTFYSLIYVVRFNAMEFIGVDAPAFAFMLLSIFSIYKKNNALFVASTVLGTLTKETTLIVLPLYFSLNFTPRQNRAWFSNLFSRTLAVCSPAILVFVLLRVLIVPDRNYSYLDLLTNTFRYRIDTFAGAISTLNRNLFDHQSSFETALVNVYRISLGAVGPALLFIIYKARRIREMIYQLLPLILLSFLQIFVAGDNERIVAAGFPAYVLCYVSAVRSFVRDDALDIRYFIFYSIANTAIPMLLNRNFYWQTYYSIAVQSVLGVIALTIFSLMKVIPTRVTDKSDGFA